MYFTYIYIFFKKINWLSGTSAFKNNLIVIVFFFLSPQWRLRKQLNYGSSDKISQLKEHPIYMLNEEYHLHLTQIDQRMGTSNNPYLKVNSIFKKNSYDQSGG